MTDPNRRSARDAGTETGGLIPDSGGLPAFKLGRADHAAIPVLIAVPHAGRGYSRSLLARMRHPHAGQQLEDRHVDRLARTIAAGSAASLVIADAPRALIDLNRAPDDIDWSMVRRDAPGEGSGEGPCPGETTIGPRSRAGLGLIPRRVPGLGEIWRGQLDLTDVRAWIAAVHAPYHALIAAELARIRSRWGAALLIDLHSMPPLPRERGARAAEFVIGDRYGASSDGALTALALRRLAANARRAAHNRPYAGGYVLERHGRPAEGIHALQIEIDRASYLDARLDEPGEGFGDIAMLLTGLVGELAQATAAIGAGRGGWAQAAE